VRLVATGEAIGHGELALSGENVVILTTLVDLTRQLSNFRNELQRLVDTHLSA
jgi:hypothetical protein